MIPVDRSLGQLPVLHLDGLEEARRENRATIPSKGELSKLDRRDWAGAGSRTGHGHTGFT